MVRTGKQSEHLGELVSTLDGGKLTVESYRLYPIDDTVAGDRVIASIKSSGKYQKARPFQA